MPRGRLERGDGPQRWWSNRHLAPLPNTLLQEMVAEPHNLSGELLPMAPKLRQMAAQSSIAAEQGLSRP